MEAPVARPLRYLCFGKRSKASEADETGERRDDLAEPMEEALDERTEARTELRVSGDMYSRSRLENRASISLDNGLRGGDISGRSSVYFESKFETSNAPCDSDGSSGGSSLRISSIFQLSPRKKGCALMASASDSNDSESGLTPSRWRASLVRRPRSKFRASLASQVGSLGLVCTILRCNSLASL
eukprot:scaffold54502_cov26-Tisochrysis_lutea.AAC.3